MGPHLAGGTTTTPSDGLHLAETPQVIVLPRKCTPELAATDLLAEVREFGYHAVDLPPLDAEALNAVRDLKHYPRRTKVPQSDAEDQENKLAKHLYKYRDKFQPSTISKLKLMQQESQELMDRLNARKLLADLREFGYRPRKIKNPNGDALLEQERFLAIRIQKSKWEECLTPAELEEFKALPRKCSPELAARELLAEVREFGYRPRQIKNTNGDALLEQEKLLAMRINNSKWEACLTPAELEEFKALPRKCKTDNSSSVQQPVATNVQQDDEHAQLSATRGPVADSQTSASAANTIAPSAARKRAASSDACNSSTARQRVSTTAARKRAASAMKSIASTVPQLDASILRQVRVCACLLQSS